MTATYSVVGGTVAATCRGAAITLDLARPDDGWRLEVDDHGSQQVEVHFRRAGAADDAGDGSKVTLRCRAGEPVRG